MKDCKFYISFDKIIFGWNIEIANNTFANILIELASYSAYSKSHVIYYDTKNITNLNFVCARNKNKKKTEEIIKKSKKKLGVKLNKEDLNNCKFSGT